MSYTHCNSEYALASAIMTELDRLGETQLHGTIHLSCEAAFLTNGVKRCSVQLECKAGCGYLIQAFGEEADILQQKANVIQSVLCEGTHKGSPKLLLEDLLSFFPELLSNSIPTMPKCAKE